MLHKTQTIKGYAIIEQRNYFKKGDTLEIFGPKKNIIEITINDMYDEDGNILEIARHPKQIIKIPLNQIVDKYDLLRIKK